VYGTKVAGLRAVLTACDPRFLSHLIVFSSLAGFHGNRGQTDYASANEVLNKVRFIDGVFRLTHVSQAAHAVQARYPNCRARAFDFGPWGGGMVCFLLLNKALTNQWVNR